VDWSLLACARYGHVTYMPDETSLHEHLSATTSSRAATWRCLRCDTFVTGEPGARGPASEAPKVRRGNEVRSSFILRVFAIERLLRAILIGAAAYVVWRFQYSRVSIEQAFDRELPLVRTLFRQLGFDIDHSKLVGLIKHALILSNGSIRLLAGLLAAYAVIEIVEGVGLWLGKRWGEYFAMVVTSIFLPYEIYELTAKVTVTRLVLFAINLALVLYLVITKRLFGVRGGKRAYEARLRSESIMENAIARAAAIGTSATGQGGATGQRGATGQASNAGQASTANSAAGSVPPAATIPAGTQTTVTPPTSPQATPPKTASPQATPPQVTSPRAVLPEAEAATVAPSTTQLTGATAVDPAGRRAQAADTETPSN
jgi:uncharacterized membrane protein (DUF2068 family)